MKSNSKDRIVIMLIVITLLITVYGLGYILFADVKTSGAFTSAIRIVKSDNLQQTERNRKYGEGYAIISQEQNKFYLQYYTSTNINIEPHESKFDLTADQYNELVENNYYWFELKYSKQDAKIDGIVKNIYTENPVR